MLKDVSRPARIRFTAVEVEQAASYGFDLRPVRSREDLVAAEIELIQRVGRARPEIIEKLVLELARVRAAMPAL